MRLRGACLLVLALSSAAGGSRAQSASVGSGAKTPRVTPTATPALPKTSPLPQPADGLTIVASNAVRPAARQELLRILNGMAQTARDIWNPYKTMTGFKIVIRGRSEKSQDLPDVIAYPFVRSWVISVGGDTRVGGGFGCNPSAPITVVSEANLLRLPDDPWKGESVVLHELSHMFLSCLPAAGLRDRVEAARAAAIGQGKWAGTYARSNAEEYWAEGVQDYFDTNLQSIPPNGIHNEIHTRAQLQTYDPALYRIIDAFFANDPWTY